MVKKKIVVGITGASGSIYAQRLLVKLCSIESQIEEITLIISDTGEQVVDYELEEELHKHEIIKTYANTSFFAPTASGSAGYHGMVIIPCTAGTMGRVASGTSNDLIARSADVMLKERKPLILVLRESPYNVIHIENMRVIAQAGGMIFPASPSFYSKPKDIIQLVDTLVDRVISLLGFEIDRYKWGG